MIRSHLGRIVFGSLLALTMIGAPGCGETSEQAPAMPAAGELPKEPAKGKLGGVAGSAGEPDPSMTPSR